jgi:hypothetical protein
MTIRRKQRRPVQGSEWMIAVRDHQLDVTAQEFALGALYGTCGNWGQRVFLSDVAVAEILGCKRQTVAGWREGLLRKGLLERLGLHANQPNQYEYRLTLPANLPKPRKAESGGDVPKTDTPCPVNGHPPVPKTDTPMSPERTQQIEEELETSPSDETSLGQSHHVSSPESSPPPGENLDEYVSDIQEVAESFGIELNEPGIRKTIQDYPPEVIEQVLGRSQLYMLCAKAQERGDAAAFLIGCIRQSLANGKTFKMSRKYVALGKLKALDAQNGEVSNAPSRN